jgi:hypothetical protein
VGRREHKSDEVENRPPSRTRRILFWLIYATVFAVVAITLLFPYDRVAKRAVVGAAASSGVALEFETFDYRFPSRIVCGGVTVTPKSDGLIGGSTYWREFECEVDVRELFGGRLDVTHFRGVLDSGSIEEGEYVVEGSLAVSGMGASSGSSSTNPAVHIRNLTVQGRGVNLSVAGDVNITGSVRSTAVDLSVDIEQLDPATSANKSLSMVFLGLKFAMGTDKPPLSITMRGRGADTVVEKKPFAGT